MATLLVPTLLVFFANVSAAHAAGNTQLLTNGTFDSSLSGWSAVQARLSLASDGDGGGNAALATAHHSKTYGLVTSSPPVTGAPAGERFTANGKVRSATPGKSVCLFLKELTPGGSTVHSLQQCATAGSTWGSLPATTLIVTTSGDSVSMTVRQQNSVSGDSFEADSLSLVDPDTTAPTAPTGVKATAASSSAVDVSWTASTDSGGGGVAGYRVDRNGTTIATLGAVSSYRDSTVSANTAYSYTVTAFDFAKNYSSTSSPATVTTPAPPVDSPPTVPGSVTAHAVSSSEVDLSWTASTDTDSTGLSGYAVTRNGNVVATLGASATSYVDTAVSPSTTYSYTVAAFDTASNYSAPSSPAASATTPAAAVTGAVDDLWHMDETSGTTMVDSGQTPHAGILHNITLGQAGDPAFPGTSYSFNGSSSGVDVGNADDLNAGSKDVHIALSLNTTTVPAQPDYDLFRKGEAPGTEYKLELQTNGQFSCEFRTLQSDGSTVTGFTIQPAIDLHDGKWHRLTCSKVGGTMTVTVDGVAFTKSITGTISNAYHMVIGAYNPAGTGDNYQGRIDEVSFHIG